MQNVQTVCGAHPSSYPTGGFLSPGVKQHGHEVNFPLPPTTVV